MSVEHTQSPDVSLPRIRLNAEKVAGLRQDNQAYAALDKDAIRGPFSPEICGEIDLVWVRTPGKKNRYLRVVNGHNRTDAAYHYQQTEEGKDFELLGRDFTEREKKAFSQSFQKELTPEQFYIVASRKKKSGQVHQRLAGHTLSEFRDMVDASDYPLSALAAATLLSNSELRSITIDNLESFLRSPIDPDTPETRITRLRPKQKLSLTAKNSSIAATLYRVAYETMSVGVQYDDVLSSMLQILREEKDDEVRETLLRQQARGFLDFPEVSQKIDQAITPHIQREQLQDGLISVLAQTIGTLRTSEDMRTIDDLLCSPEMDYSDLETIFAPLPSDKQADETVSVILERKDRVQNKKNVEQIAEVLYAEKPQMIEGDLVKGGILTNLAGTDSLNEREIHQLVVHLIAADKEMLHAKRRLAGHITDEERIDIESRINAIQEATSRTTLRARVKALKDYFILEGIPNRSQPETVYTANPEALRQEIMKLKACITELGSENNQLRDKMLELRAQLREQPATPLTSDVSPSQLIEDVQHGISSGAFTAEDLDSLAALLPESPPSESPDGVEGVADARLVEENEALKRRLLELEWWLRPTLGLTKIERICAEAHARNDLQSLVGRYTENEIWSAVQSGITKRRSSKRLSVEEAARRRRNGL